MTDNQQAQSAYVTYYEAMGSSIESATASWEILVEYRQDLVEIWRKVAEAVLAVKAN